MINMHKIIALSAPLLMLAACLAGVAGCGPRAPGHMLEMPCLIERLADRDFIARLDAGYTDLVSSSDPAGGNNDFNNFVRPGPPGWVVLADLAGPGYVSRFWFTGGRPDRRLRFYFDGARRPAIDTTIGEFFGGMEPFRPPLAAYDNLCYYNYVPIPYARRLVIETEEGGTQPGGWPRLFYQINYASLPDGWGVRSLELPLDDASRAALSQAAAAWQAPDELPDGLDEKSADLVLAPGAAGRAVLPAGPAVLRAIEITPDFAALPNPAAREALLRDVVLRIFWDGRSEPSVVAPLGDFGGSCWLRTRYQGMFFGMDGDTWSVRFPMPFAGQASIELENQGTHTVAAALRMRWSPLPEWDAGRGYFHAAWRRSTPDERGRPHVILDTEGRGRFAGCLLAVVSQDESFWILEGDEVMWRDGRPRPFWDGTGLEDYFNGGWYYQNVMARPLHGLPWKTFFRTVQYRVHLPDAVGFDSAFRMIFERGPEHNSRGWMESLAWYYLDRPAASDTVLPAPPDRRPPPDPALPDGVMIVLLNFERFDDYAGAGEYIDGLLEQYPHAPFADMLRLRQAAYIERQQGHAAAEPLYRDFAAGDSENPVTQQARMLLDLHARPDAALLGLNANMPARVFVNGEVVLQSSAPGKLDVLELNLEPGQHVLAVQCQYRPYPSWMLLYLRRHDLAVFTTPAWRHAVNPAGAWWLAGYDDRDWLPVGGTGCKGPPEEPWLTLEPNAFVDMQSQAVGLRPSADWPTQTGTVVYRRVFEVPAPPE